MAIATLLLALAAPQDLTVTPVARFDVRGESLYSGRTDPTRTWLLTHGLHGDAVLWQWPSLTEIARFDFGVTRAVGGTWFHPSRPLVAWDTDDRAGHWTVELLDLEKARHTRIYHRKDKTFSTKWRMGWLADGQSLVIEWQDHRHHFALTDDNLLQPTDTTSEGEFAAHPPGDRLTGNLYDDDYTPLTAKPDATPPQDASPKELQNFRAARILAAHRGNVREITFTEDCRFVVAAGDSAVTIARLDGSIVAHRPGTAAVAAATGSKVWLVGPRSQLLVDASTGAVEHEVSKPVSVPDGLPPLRPLAAHGPGGLVWASHREAPLRLGPNDVSSSVVSPAPTSAWFAAIATSHGYALVEQADPEWRRFGDPDRLHLLSATAARSSMNFEGELTAIAAHGECVVIAIGAIWSNGTIKRGPRLELRRADTGWLLRSTEVSRLTWLAVRGNTLLCWEDETLCVRDATTFERRQTLDVKLDPPPRGPRFRGTLPPHQPVFALSRDGKELAVGTRCVVQLFALR